MLPSFCSWSAKSCAAAKAAVPGNGLPPAASKLAVSVASVQHPSGIHYRIYMDPLWNVVWNYR